MKDKAPNLVGETFGKLTVIRRAANTPSGNSQWECLCECGEHRAIAGGKLRAGLHKSCGCSSPKFKPKHDIEPVTESESRTLSIWRGMHARCRHSANEHDMRYYYLKGIRVCDRWRSYENFLSDMGHVPDGCSIDRIDSSKGYEPLNCRWATPRQQGESLPSTKKFELDGVEMTLSDIAEMVGIKKNTLVYRLRRGMSLEHAAVKDLKHASTTKKEERKRECAICGAEFIPRTAQVRAGQGLVCSVGCRSALLRQRVQSGMDAG